ncbi:MAG: septum formation initiator family protein [Patescibacteria group bacterium]|nr:septum formation initiator family protein [Patescibacteria group bacterium]
MFNRKKKNLFSRLFFNQYWIAVFVLVLLFLISIPLARNISKKYDIDSEVRALEDEIAGLQKKNIELEKFIDDYGSSDFVEEIARLNLGLKKEGEEVLVVKRGNIDNTNENSLGINKEIEFVGDVKENNPSKWLRYFFKK